MHTISEKHNGSANKWPGKLSLYCNFLKNNSTIWDLLSNTPTFKLYSSRCLFYESSLCLCHKLNLSNIDQVSEKYINTNKVKQMANQKIFDGHLMKLIWCSRCWCIFLQTWSKLKKFDLGQNQSEL
jgi:hypothetical protein